jgi:hypothetical protein
LLPGNGSTFSRKPREPTVLVSDRHVAWLGGCNVLLCGPSPCENRLVDGLIYPTTILETSTSHQLKQPTGRDGIESAHGADIPRWAMGCLAINSKRRLVVHWTIPQPFLRQLKSLPTIFACPIDMGCGLTTLDVVVITD